MRTGVGRRETGITKVVLQLYSQARDPSVVNKEDTIRKNNREKKKEGKKSKR